MTNVIDAIKNRRSTRKYTTRKIANTTLHEILEAATWAPSAHNAQPWRFTVLTKTAEKKSLAKAMAKAWVEDLIKNNMSTERTQKLAERSTERFTKPPIIVVACVTITEMPNHADCEAQEIERDLAVQSLGAAVQNMLLAAYANGLGACCWCAPAFCKHVVREALDLPQSYEPQALVTLGYPNERPEAVERKPFLEVFHYGFWKKGLSD